MTEYLPTTPTAPLPTYVTEVPTVPDPFSIPGLVKQVSDGGLAIVILLGVAVRWFGGDIKKYLAVQIETLDQLKSDVVTNSSTLKALADTDTRMVETVHTMTKNHASVEAKITEIARLNEELHRKTHDLLEDLTKKATR